MSDENFLEQRRLARQEKAKRDAELMQLHVEAANALAGSGAQQVRERALLKIDAWEKKGLCSRYYIDEWRRMLNLPLEAMRQAMLRQDEQGWGTALRQNTPFGFLMRQPQ